LILCEDTRTSFPLLKKFEIDTRLKSYHKFNERESIQSVIDMLAADNDVALITDAGTPCVSDPGAKLVEAAANEGIEVTPVPGACAAIAALSISGFNAVSFVFRGFLPRKKGELKRVLVATLTEPSPISIFYESPMRIISTVTAMTEVIPVSKVCLCNDLTKSHERIYRGLPGEILDELEHNSKASKGEYTIVLARANIKPEEIEDDED
jgi:16S rRNA (cytidine1402-2'-O)-methyltransferase